MPLTLKDDFCPLSRLLGRFEGQRDAAMGEARMRRAEMAGHEPGTVYYNLRRDRVVASVRRARMNNHAAIQQMTLIRRYLGGVR